MDLILASGSPFVAFRLAKTLSDRLGRPYVLDYRDPWTGNPHNVRPSRISTIREEASLLEGCAAVTIVSPSWGAALDRSYGVGAKLHVVTNGYDPNEMGNVQGIRLWTLCICLYREFLSAETSHYPVFGCAEAPEGEPWRTQQAWFFHYYGRDESHVREQAERFGVSDRVVLHGRVSRHEVLIGCQRCKTRGRRDVNRRRRIHSRTKAL